MDKPYSSFIGISLKAVPFLYAMLERLNKAIASMQADGTEAKLKIKWMGAAD